MSNLLTAGANYRLNPVLPDLRAGGNLMARFCIMGRGIFRKDLPAISSSADRLDRPSKDCVRRPS
jgi:hypothetical protein